MLTSLIPWLLPTLLHPALAATTWTATCPVPTDPSVWFVFSSAPDAAPLTDYDCKGLFFENASCTQTVGIGKIRPSGTSLGGIPLLELRYLPYGDIPTIIAFLSRVDGGVLYKPPVVAATTYAATPPPDTAGDLMQLYLDQRNKASAATKNITLHIWICPGAGFEPPLASITAVGTTLATHTGKAPAF